MFIEFEIIFHEYEIYQFSLYFFKMQNQICHRKLLNLNFDKVRILMF